MAPSSSPPVPRHVAVIMDGNGRWARERNLPRLKGHQAGAESVRACLRACQELGVTHLTLYAFSSENWRRPEEEVRGLMGLMKTFLDREEKVLHENRIRLRIIGRLDRIEPRLRDHLAQVVEKTRDYDRAHLTVALSYGGRAEIADAARRLAERVRAGEIAPEDIDEEAVAAHLYAPDVPDPDLMIRTSGERRISNFLLWQLSYAELYFTEVLWPDFREAHFREAVADYQHRKRRFGRSE